MLVDVSPVHGNVFNAVRVRRPIIMLSSGILDCNFVEFSS